MDSAITLLSDDTQAKYCKLKREHEIRLDVEILDLECVFFNEVAPWLHVITH